MSVENSDDEETLSSEEGNRRGYILQDQGIGCRRQPPEGIVKNPDNYETSQGVLPIGNRFEMKLFKGRPIKTNTINGYIRCLRKLGGRSGLPSEPTTVGLCVNDKGELKNLDCFSNPTEIIQYLSAKNKPRTVLNYCIAICSAFGDQKKYADRKKQYAEKMIEINTEFGNKDNSVKSDAQVENWVSYPDLLKKQQELEDEVYEYYLKDELSGYWNKVLTWLLLSLYTLTEPRRTIDYTQCYVCKRLPSILNPALNYLDLQNRTFVFQNYKTSSVYNTQVVKIPKKLNGIIGGYLIFHPDNDKLETGEPIPFICDKLGNQLCSGKINDSYKITRILNDIYFEDKKKISVNLLRNIYATHFLSKSKTDKKRIAEKMGTSTGMLDAIYVK